MTDLPFDSKEPELINDKGTKFWRDPDCQVVADRIAPHVSCFFIEHSDGEQARMICEGQQIVRVSPRYEDIIVSLEMEAASKDIERECRETE